MIISKIDDVMGDVQLDDEEKTEFVNSQTKLRRKLEQDLRSFREYLDQEANKKLTDVYSSAMQQQEMNLAQAITNMQLYTRMYYLKQIQQQEDFLYCMEVEKHTVKQYNHLSVGNTI